MNIDSLLDEIDMYLVERMHQLSERGCDLKKEGLPDILELIVIGREMGICAQMLKHIREYNKGEAA